MAVPPEIIDEIRNHVDIVRVIGESVPLKKMGRNHVGLCPFHQEKSPSFTVSDSKQLFHCFGCGEGGTVFNFLMKLHRLTFPEVLERLAPHAGIDLKKYQKVSRDLEVKKDQKRRLVKVLEYARDAYHRAFMESKVGSKARDYAKGRGISLEQAKMLKLGFAPEGWDTLVQAMVRDQISLEDAAQAGLIQKRPRESGYYDVFRDRLIFPIEDAQGSTVGFGGRVFGNEPPKYLNSPQTPVFDKGHIFYGLFTAQGGIENEKRAIVVEGYMDQVALRLAGVRNAIATLGTALTEHHARLISKYTSEVVVVFDGDEAGLKAARRSMRTLIPQGLKVKVALLPKGVDPDSFIQEQGKKKWDELVATAISMSEFFVSQFFKRESDVTRKAQAVEEIVDMISGTQNQFLREALVDEMHQLTEIEKTLLRGERKSRQWIQSPAKAVQSSAEAPEIPAEMLTLLRLSAEVKQVRSKLVEQNIFSFFPIQTQEIARKWIQNFGESEVNEMPVSKYVDEWEDEGTRPLLAKCFIEGSLSYQNAWEQVFNDCARKLRQREIRRLSEKVGEEERAGREVVDLLKRVEELKRMDQQAKPLDGGRNG